MLSILLKFAVLLPGMAMCLLGGYGMAAFLPRLLRNPDDSLSQIMLGTSVMAMIWGIFQLWTSYRAYHQVHDEGEE